ncbi:tRNA (adenosine(37)-N6)-threonylcarbamoyltransferase complex transferase subunit TsaD [Clostridia bacterium]|nr:tRNA (adenosine(37)-N6)-threonylcarbamoyltransferase complex transferase subunit TsaD [Clostridia bacterium]
MTEKPRLLLALETSCDETSAAVIENGSIVRSNIISSQIDIHKLYGGVVPEIASRKHLENVLDVVEMALKQANVDKKELDCLAVTYGPGLVGALLVGVSLAKSLAYALKIPLVPVHHLLGHMYANLLSHPDVQFPLICTVVSGGHTSIIYWEDHGKMSIMGQTRDDAAGEAFDKVARVLGFDYPGGPEIEKAARKGVESIQFPRAYLEADSYDFSFSGLKSSVINYLHKNKQNGNEVVVEDVARSFQEALIEVLAVKTLRAAKEKKVRTVALAGGVASNQALRRIMKEKLDPEGIELIFPESVLCTDNAAMIGAAAYHLAGQGKEAGLDLNAVPSIPIHG